MEVNLADVQNDEGAFRKVKLKKEKKRKFKLSTEDVQHKNFLTKFYGVDLTCDKMCSMVNCD